MIGSGGTISSSIGSLDGLTSIDLVGNNLEDSVPASIGSLSNLEELYQILLTLHSPFLDAPPKESFVHSIVKDLPA